MSVHLVLAHPLADSLNARLAGRAAQACAEAGQAVDRLDLYAEGFAPALTVEERTNHYGTPRPGADARALQARLGAAEHLVLVFPTWWFAMPATLKGWFDRVWGPGFAFDHGTPIRPRLTHLRSVTIVTTLGSPWWIDTLVMRRPVRRVLGTAIVGACAPQARFAMLSLYAAETVTQDRLARFEAAMERTIARQLGR